MADRMYPIEGKNPINGEPVSEYPSVTTITGMMDTPFLIQAAVNVAVDYLADVRFPITNERCINARTEHSRQWGEAALFGTMVHAIAEHYFRAKMARPDDPASWMEDDPPVSYVKEHRQDGQTQYEDCLIVWDDLFRKLYKGLHDWCKRNKVVPISTEEVLYGEGYAGRYDLVCKLGKEQIITMVDVKTGKGSYYDSWKPQLAAYRKAYNKKVIDRFSYETSARRDELRKALVQAHGFLKWNKATEKWNYKDFSVDCEIDYQIFLDYRNAWWHNEIKKQNKTERKDIERAKKWIK